MKKWFLLFISLLLVPTLALAGCTGPEAEVEPEVEAKETVSDPVTSDMNRFASDELGFAISYPDNWIYELDGHIVVFSGLEGTEAYNATVNVQTIQWGATYNTFDDFYEDYKGQIEGLGGRISELIENDFFQAGAYYDSVGFVAEYPLEAVDYAQIIAAIDRGDGYLHQISYTAPTEIYDQYEDTAIDTMDSLELLGVGN